MSIRNVPVLMSPYVRGRKQFEDPITPEEHERHWDRALAHLRDFGHIMAYQDGQVEFEELEVFMEINARLAIRHGLRAWSNVETFEHGMPIDFLPIAWPNLRYKMEVAAAAGGEKLITFEFPHSLSPNSMSPSAHNLFRHYCEWLFDGHKGCQTQ
jgi:hypothetical protein